MENKKICVTSDPFICLRWMSQHCVDQDEIQLFGVDLEWTSSAKVDVLQIANQSKQVLLAQITLWESPIFLSTFQSFFSSSTLVKGGNGLKQDCERLVMDYPALKVNGCLELQDLCQQYYPSLYRSSLQAMTKVFLDVELSKTPAIRCSQWNAQDLTSLQIEYAAQDAIVSYEVLVKLLEHIHTSEYRDEPFSTTLEHLTHKFQLQIENRPLREKKKHPKQAQAHAQKQVEARKEARRSVYKELFSRKTGLYDNCLLQAPDGELLAKCNEKKIRWYVKRGLAEIVKDNPLTATLTFEPNARDSCDTTATQHVDASYACLDKVNACVVCGEEQYLVRHYVVPHSIRKHFPLEYKNHCHHDVVLLCTNCHSSSGKIYEDLKTRLCNHFHIDKKLKKFIVNQELHQVVKAATALRHHRHRIPQNRQEQYQKVLREYDSTLCFPDIKSKDLDERLRELEHLDPQEQNPLYIEWEVSLVQKARAHYGDTQGIEYLIITYRQAFVERLNPQHLPTGWAIYYKVNPQEV